MNYLFYNCSLLSTLDLSDVDAFSITSMDYTFGNCISLSILNISNWLTSSVTSMRSISLIVNH